MRKTSIDAVDPQADEGVYTDRRSLTGPLNASNVAVVRYVLDPGERFSGAVHAHADQEELFLVVSGTAVFETEDGDVTVDAGEAVRFAPGEFQSGRNASDDPVVAFAIGAPRESDDVRVSRVPVLDDADVSCPECGRDDMRLADADGDRNADFVCPDCDATLSVP